MPDWAKPDPEEIQSKLAAKANEPRASTEQKPVIIAPLPQEDDKKPESIDEIREAMQRIVAAPVTPAPAIPSKKNDARRVQRVRQLVNRENPKSLAMISGEKKLAVSCFAN
ncbi:hypothetical protein [Glutamicibacter sp. M10]|uniref:hypothetical protein n=1 Tax=Glutamicibacter sp. M10 TaxID=3023076 RepID=UPI0021C84DCA|nr:hypothetical protein [Glutamicibacter sp. M10]UXN31547.1 hypothetical protein N6V40_14570 [Glutamicibacter sp. M10]